MQLRRLGSAGPVTSAIGLGTLGLTGGYGPVDRDEAVATLWHALDAGVTLLDTADFYGGGAVESLLGTAIKGRRDDVVVATRGGALFTPEGRPLGVDGSPQRLRAACDASLRRLGVDHIDLYYLARVDPEVPVEESTGALAELVAAGKVRHIGLSEVSAQELRRAAAVHPVAALASEYSLFERQIEGTVLPVARELGVGLVACSPLGRGLLTGRLTSVDQLGDGDYRRNHPRFAPEHFARNRALVRRAERLAAERDVSVGRLVLAWLLAQGPDVVPIPGTRCTTNLEMNVAATRVRLTEQELRLLAEAIPPDAVSGDRSPRR
ncbi:aldo/keto reductase [Micromonospora sp. NPDC050980]|uniref:aldo/keto reductase n=1 Tax=Micromonospora sp. NPDC050980 TaxID=3155161 RepID=UPI0033D4261D